MRVGILGGGQLGRMIALAACPLGIPVRLFETSADACGGQVTELFVGDYLDFAALKTFSDGLDVITYEFENVPVATADFLSQTIDVHPPPRALEVAQNRLVEKTFFRDLGIPTAHFAAVDSAADLSEFCDRHGWPVVLKTRRMGYDGKGQAVLRGSDEHESGLAALGGKNLIAESFVPFDRELSILGVRGKDGSIRFYPLIENQHREGILRVSRAPAGGVSPILQTTAERYATAALEALGYVGVLAIEFFTQGGALLANEMAPRVHNSGHWTIEGADTGQFENHLRAVAGLPLGSTRARGHTAMVNLIGTLPDQRRILSVEGAHLHLYGKSPRPGRKLGHVTLCAESDERLVAQFNTLLAIIS